ncbi:Carboxypeptidase B2 [Dissostichus eleginoides]|uniref:Carboxypeptidase B2 n=1 Tax=Dissostichus eleginoides TaxID=100907 RepID=A0AAD9B883_DISEL|nr:Carboxypeptidase B2 [Dissostichus eleginoides]
MKALLIWFVLMNLDKLLKTAHCTETQDQILSITPKTQEQVDILKNVSTQYETALWQPVSPYYIKEDTQVHLFVPANSSETVKDLLLRHAITHEVLLANPNELIEMQTRNDSTDPRSSSTFYERYHSLEDIYFWINRTQQDNPDTVKVILIGSSFEKRPLYVLKLSVNNRPNKKAMWIDCGIHAREWISPAFCLWFVQYSLSFYHSNRDITNILDNMDVYILPVLNPDGYHYTWTTETENHSELLEIVQEAAQKIKRHYRNIYEYGSGAKTIYLAPGGSDDWAYNLGIKYSFTFELQDRGRYGFLLPPSHISKACNEALLAVKTIALKVIEKTQAPTTPA